MIRILHASDIHIGSKFSFLGPKAGEYRRAIIDTFEKIIDLAIDEGVNLFIITGDLFDNAYPSKANIEIVKKAVDKLVKAGVYVAMIPGNHDALVEGSVYLSEDFGDKSKVYVFNDPKQTRHIIPELGVGLYAKANTSNKSVESPLVKVLPQSDTPLPEAAKSEIKYKIGLAHGSVDIRKDSTGNFPIRTEDIDNSGYDYVALGDWHGLLEVPTRVKAYYPGSPEPLAIDQENSGHVLLVDVDNSGTTVTSRRVGEFKIVNLEVKPDHDNLIETIENKLKSLDHEHKKLMVTVNIEGIRDLETEIDLSEVEDYFVDKYFSLRVQDKTDLKISDAQLQKYPEYTVIGKYIKKLRMRKDVDSNTIDEAIQRGVSLLRKEQ